jgi:PAS domain S-box-containing protein
LEQSLAELQLQSIVCAEDLEWELSHGQFDLVITDYDLGWTDGLTILRTIKTRYPDCPVIMFTGSGSQEVAVEAMKAGLDDYVIKAPRHFTRLPAAVSRALTHATVQRHTYELESRLQFLLNDLEVGVYRLTTEESWLEGNPAFWRLLDLDQEAESLPIESLATYFQPADYAELLAQLGQTDRTTVGAASNQIQEVLLRQANGGRRWVRINKRSKTIDGNRMIAGIIEDISDRKSTEAALQYSEEQLQTALQAARIVAWSWNAETNHITRSRTAHEVLGLPINALHGSGDEGWQLVHPDDLAQHRANVQAAIDARGSYISEFRVIRPNDGKVIWVEDRGRVTCDAMGKLVSIQGMLLDITDRKQVEAKLHQREQAFRALVENSPDVVARQNRQLRFVYVNPTIERATGLPPKQLHNKTLLELGFPQSMADCWNSAVQEVFTTGKSRASEFEYLSPHDGLRFYQTRFVPEFAQNGSISTVLSISRDVTDYKRAEMAVRENEARLRLILESAKDYAILTLDMAGNITSWNSGAQRLLGYEESEILGQNVRIIFTPDDNAQAEAERELQLATVEGRANDERWHVRKDGKLFWASGLVMALRDGANQVHGFLKIMQDRTEQQRNQESLRLSESRYRTLANAVSLLMWVNDAQGNIQFFNQRWQAYTGIADLELGVGLWRDLIHPDDYQPTFDTRLDAIQRGEAYEVKCRLKRYDQTYRWHLARVVPLRDDRGEVISWFGTATDIEDIQRLGAEQRFLAETSSTLAASLDYQTTLRTIAQLAVPFLADYCFFDIVTTDDRIERVTWHHVNPEAQAWFGQAPQFVPQVTDAHPVAQVLLSGEAIFVPQVTDEWMQSIATSPGHLQFMRTAQLQSTMTVPLIARDRRLGALTVCYTAESGRVYSEADLALAKELAHRAALALDNAQLYHQAQEANRIKDEFLAVLSHELRSPLNPILGWTKLLRTRKFDAVATDRALATIERNAKVQIQLIDDLLDVARILRGKLSLEVTSVDLATTIEAAIETVRLAAEAKSIRIQTDFAYDVGPVAGDAGRLQQVVWNLLSNAVKFTPAGGQIHVQLERVEWEQGNERAGGSTFPPQPPGLSAPQPHLAQITITDTGKGISPEFLPYIFDYFRQADSSTTRKFGGLGLGLAIVRHIVEVHGGTVHAVSPGEGQGASFIVRLPLMKSNTIAETEVTDRSPLACNLLPLEGVRAVIVDDEADARELLTVTLQQAGAIVLTATSAMEALQILTQFVPQSPTQSISQSSIDVLISDIGMPDVDGYMLIQQIRALPTAQSKLPAIALTAYAGESNQKKAIEAGFQRHLAKPVEPEVLVETVAALVGR